MTERQCSSCGGFCKRSGCERENVKRLADALETLSPLERDAAAELRRLHAENEDHIQQLRKEQLEVERMHRVNAQLLEALESMVASCWSDGFTNRKYNSDEHEENVRRDLVLAAIAAAKEKV